MTGIVKRLDDEPRFATIVLGVAMVALSVLVLRITRGTIYYYDEWNFVLGRRGFNSDTLLNAHNGHLSLVPVVIYKTLVKVFGLGDAYLPLRLTVLALHLGAVALLFEYARRRVGTSIALAAALSLLWLGSGWEDFLWPFQIGYLAAIVSGLAALLALDRNDRRGDRAATILLCGSLASSGVGVAFTLVLVVRALWKDERRRMFTVLALPVGLYLIWLLAFGDSQITKDSAIEGLQFAADMAAGAFGGLFGLSIEWGRTIAFAGFVALVYFIGRTDRLAASISVAAMGIGFWLLTGASRSLVSQAESSRYIYVGVVGILLVALDMARGKRLPVRSAALLYGVLAFAVVANLGDLRSGGRYLRSTDSRVKAELFAVELARANVDPQLAVDQQLAPQINLAQYFDAIDDHGSPAGSVEDLQAAAGSDRQAADAALVRALGLRLAPEAGRGSGPTPAIVSSTVDASTRGSCVAFARAGTAAIQADPGSVLRIDGRPLVSVNLRRFGDTFPRKPTLTADKSRTHLLRLPADGLGLPWIVAVSSRGAFAVCARRR